MTRHFQLQRAFQHSAGGEAERRIASRAFWRPPQCSADALVLSIRPSVAPEALTPPSGGALQPPLETGAAAELAP
jgi:hypothetical protein